MDCSWLVEDNDEGNTESESDSEKEHNELEERLYGIIHHSSKDELLAPEIAKNFSIQCAEDGEIIVELNKSLEEIKSEESKHEVIRYGNIIDLNSSTDEVLPNNNNNINDDDIEVIAISESYNKREPQQNCKRFRYSDVNIDQNEKEEIRNQELSSKTIDYFKVGQNFFKKNRNRKFLDLVIPNSLQSTDWKIDANESFISIQAHKKLNGNEVVDKMVEELKKANPHKRKGLLQNFAWKLYTQNTQRLKEERKSKSKNSKVSITNINGSISLNKSPFIPYASTPYKLNDSTPSIDLTENETNLILNNQNDNTECSSHSGQTGIPKKWTKEMINYYTVPSRKKMVAHIEGIIENLRKTSVAEDWWLHPKDKKGTYKIGQKMRITGGRRCANCREFGHFIRDCPKPKKIMTCTLCGEYYHNDYTCPNTICRKCGICLPNNLNPTYDTGGLCEACYRSDYDCALVCKVCGQYTHYTRICPDLWRKFHATTNIDSELIIPENVAENPRKYCCNCARRGHFSHQCLEPGDKTCAMITNYSEELLDLGSTEVSFSNDYLHVVNNYQFDKFLEHLATKTTTSIYYAPSDVNCVFRIHGTFHNCKDASSEIQKYVNTKKRKRGNEPYLNKKKKRRI